MSDRRQPITKKPSEVLDDCLRGHDEALMYGVTQAKQYLVNYIDKYNSIPNWVKNKKARYDIPYRHIETKRYKSYIYF